ncbi:hypothetical protein RvY_17151-2 [Ramazzottius varieornatus]|nr:hypothetical protein RvY_17151-2 [Ramazzottius varieornatus]
MLHWRLLNPCLRPSDHNCLTDSTVCRHVIGDRYAFTCPCRPGFKALSLTDHRDQCVDIDECLVKPHKRPCQPPDIATCTNTAGSYECDCPDKYRLTNTSTTTYVMLQCIERDRCKDDKTACGQDVNGGICDNNGYPDFTCSCFPGFTQIADLCVDLNECEDKTVLDSCADQFAQCVNKQGFYECQCSPGFHRDAVEKVCKISAHAYTIKLRLAMPPNEEYSNVFSADFKTFSNDTQTVLGAMFQNVSHWPCAGTKFLDSQVSQITKFGESYVDATIVMNFDEVSNSSVDCPINNVTSTIKTRLPALCDAENHLTGGTCALEGTSLRVPIVTRIVKSDNNTVNRALPDDYEKTIVGETVKFGCDEANDCSYRHYCEQADSTNSSVYPYNCKCKDPYIPVGNVDNKEVCLDACYPSPCLDSPCEYQSQPPYYTCNCLESYYGVNCSDVPCSPSYCHERGICMVVEGKGQVCECESPYSGVNCEKNVPQWLMESFGAYAGVFLGVSVIGWSARYLMTRNIRKNWWPHMQPPKVKLI